MKRVIDSVYLVAMGKSNAYLIEGQDGLTLIDAGFPDKEAAVFRAIRELGRSPDQLRHLILTHGHPDHIGSAAAIVRETGARTYLHPLDIPLAETGGPFRPMTPAPGLLRQILCRVIYDHNQRLAPVAIDQPFPPTGEEQAKRKRLGTQKLATGERLRYLFTLGELYAGIWRLEADRHHET